MSKLAQPTYRPIASITLGSSASSVTFSSIPQDYRDLVLVVNAEFSANLASIEYYFNADTANGSLVKMTGDGSSSASSSRTRLEFTGATTPTLVLLQVMDYSVTDKHKTVLVRSNMAEGPYVEASAGRWASTNAITSLTIEEETGITINSGSTFALYGIEA